MDCKQAQPLVPSYADGELSELQAGRFRKHLMDCQACRALVQEEKSFQSWFVPTEPVAVPEGFAARVARRAFAGDAGVLTPAAPPEPVRREAPILQFSLKMAMAAAVVLMVASLGIGLVNQPDSGDTISADENEPEFHEVLNELDKLKAEDAARELEKLKEEAEAR